MRWQFSLSVRQALAVTSRRLSAFYLCVGVCVCVLVCVCVCEYVCVCVSI